MQEKELWNYFWSKRVTESKFLGRYLIWVYRKDFIAVRNLFKKEYNFIHPDKSYRSSAYIRHLHAVDEGEYFCIHQDTGNMSKFFPLGIVHLLLDVVPGYIYCYKNRVSAKSLTVFPKRDEIE